MTETAVPALPARIRRSFLDSVGSIAETIGIAAAAAIAGLAIGTLIS